MALEFHRLNTPTYHEDTIGGGTHDHINDPVANGYPTSIPAPYSPMKPTGPYAGTYFVVLGEEAFATHFNRTNFALAENTDYLDNLAHRDLAVPVMKLVTVNGGGLTADIPGDIFVGMPGTPNTQLARDGLVEFYDKDGLGNPVGPAVAIVSGDYVPIVAVAIEVNGGGTNIVGDGAPGDGDGFYTDPTITFSTPLAPGATYLALCYERSNFANQEVGIFTRLVWGRPALSEIVAQVFNLVTFNPAQAWHDTSTVGVQDLESAVRQIITDLVNDAGADRVGAAASSPWKDTTPNSAGSIQDRIDNIISDLGVSTSGSSRINSKSYVGSSMSLSNDVSIYTQLTQIVDFLDAPVFPTNPEVPDDIVFSSPQSRTTIFSATDFVDDYTGGLSWPLIVSGLSFPYREKVQPGEHAVMLQLNGKLPDGAIIRYVEFLVNDNSGTIMNVSVRCATVDWATPSLGSRTTTAAYVSSGSGGLEKIRIPYPSGTISETLSDTNFVWLEIGGGSSSAPSRFYAARVHWDQPSVSHP